MGQLYYDVVFVVDSASHLCATFPILLRDYLEPAVQHFAGPLFNLKTVMAVENGQCQFGVVVMAPMGGADLHHASYRPSTSDPNRLLDELRSIKFAGGLYMKYCPLADGLAACMEYLDSFNETREGSFHGSLQRHCIVVTNRDTYPGACEQSSKHSGKTATQLAKELGEGGVKLSVVCPRQLTSLKQLFEACKAVSDVQVMSDLQHATSPAHLVLLHGFQLPGSHKKQVEPAEPVVSDSLPAQSQSATSFSMATSYSDNVSTASSILSSAGLNDGVSQGVTQTNVSQPPNVVDDVMATVTSSSAGQGANQIDMPAMSLGSRLTVAINSNVTIDSNMNTGTVTTAMSSLEPFNLGVSSVSSQSQSSLSSSWLSLGGSPSGKMTSPSYNEGMDLNTNKGPMTSLQQPITGKVSTTAPGIQPIMSKLLTEISNTSSVGSTSLSSTGGVPASTSVGGVEVKTELNTSLAVTSGTGLGMNSGTSSGMPSGINTGLNTGVSSGMSTSGMGLGINTGMNSGVGPGGVGSGINLGINTGVGGFQSRVPGMNPGMNPGMGMPSSMSGTGMGPSSSIAMPTGMQQPPDIYPNPAGVGGAPSSAMIGQNAQAQQTQVIWTGSIEVSEMRDGLREMRTIRCSIASKVASKSILKPELWPPKMILQPYPRTIYQSVLAQLKNRSVPITTTMVTFSFLEPVASINTLKMLTSAEQQRLGMVQLLGTQPMCPVKSMILTWNNQQFVGYVPSEQDKFLMVFRQTLQELQQQGGSGGVQHSSGLPPSLQPPSNLPPKIQQLLERSKPEDQKIILEKVRRMRQLQQQQAQMAAAVGGGGAMDQQMGLQQANQPMGIMGQGNMMQPMGGLAQGRQMQSQTMQMHSQPMGMQQAGQMQTAQPMGLQQGHYQNQPMGMPQSNPSTDPNYFLNRP
ncbi:mediator of RNA polymerase II transcription subunit 25-like isoform X2 [Dysidea avara]|uniref:mediator of RNA polymerase II transcription subunit 25-like isoform X2 n=1 Tax=Dysidea avara TaxID=196820 RepID=UPI00332D1F04